MKKFLGIDSGSQKKASDLNYSVAQQTPVLNLTHLMDDEERREEEIFRSKENKLKKLMFLEFPKSDLYDLQKLILRKAPERRIESEIKFLSQSLRDVRFFSDLAEHHGQNIMEQTLRKLVFIKANFGEFLFQKNDIGDRFYIILKGKVGVLVPVKKDDEEYEAIQNRRQQLEKEKELTLAKKQIDSLKDRTPAEALQRICDKYMQKEIRELEQGQSFGEIALSKGVNKRNATIIAKCYCEFAILNKADYQQILGDLEDIQLQDRIAFLRTLPFFSHWASLQFKRISYFFQQLDAEKGSYVFREGDAAREVYFVLRGEFALKKNIYHEQRRSEHEEYITTHHRSEIEITRLCAGEVFGEEECFRQRKREYSVQAISLDAQVLRISYHDICYRFFDQQSIKQFKDIITEKRIWRIQRLEEVIINLKKNTYGKSERAMRAFDNFYIHRQGKRVSSDSVWAKWNTDNQVQENPNYAEMNMRDLQQALPVSVHLNENMMHFMRNQKSTPRQFLAIVEKQMQESLQLAQHQLKNKIRGEGISSQSNSNKNISKQQQFQEEAKKFFNSSVAQEENQQNDQQTEDQKSSQRKKLQTSNDLRIQTLVRNQTSQPPLEEENRLKTAQSAYFSSQKQPPSRLKLLLTESQEVPINMFASSYTLTSQPNIQHYKTQSSVGVGAGAGGTQFFTGAVSPAATATATPTLMIQSMAPIQISPRVSMAVSYSPHMSASLPLSVLEDKHFPKRMRSIVVPNKLMTSATLQAPKTQQIYSSNYSEPLITHKSNSPSTEAERQVLPLRMDSVKPVSPRASMRSLQKYTAMYRYSQLNAMERDSTAGRLREMQRNELTIENFNLVQRFKKFRVQILSEMAMRREYYLKELVKEQKRIARGDKHDSVAQQQIATYQKIEELDHLKQELEDANFNFDNENIKQIKQMLTDQAAQSSEKLVSMQQITDVQQSPHVIKTLGETKQILRERESTPPNQPLSSPNRASNRTPAEQFLNMKLLYQQKASLFNTHKKSQSLNIALTQDKPAKRIKKHRFNMINRGNQLIIKRNENFEE